MKVPKLHRPKAVKIKVDFIFLFIFKLGNIKFIVDGLIERKKDNYGFCFDISKNGRNIFIEQKTRK